MAMGWSVISQRSQDNLTPQGTFEPVWVITYKTDPEGVVGTLTVSDRLYSADYVQAAIEEQVARIKEIHNL
jgi:hypothetical protein